MSSPTGPQAPLTGRVRAVPDAVWHDEVLEQQFAHDLLHLLPWYVATEKAVLLEYARMGLLAGDEVAAIARRLHGVRAGALSADPAANLSDLAFALERYVTAGLASPIPAWHVDRSRNDLQACAQLMGARERVLEVAEALVAFAAAAVRLAERGLDMPMPGHTHLQAAQVITPGFYASAVVAEALDALRRLASTHDGMNLCPLGAGAMAGQELPWDRPRMAALLGFRAAQPHALSAVASRGWALEVAAGLAILGVSLSRITTDLMTWGGGDHGFIDLPDELASVSSAMPQKRSFPILERIRGRTAHLTAGFVDIALAQRNTPYTNMVEVSKEASAPLPALFEAARSALRLATTVLDRLRLHPDRMRAACERDHLGGFTLANLLTLRCAVPWRTAQVIVGRYVAAAVDRGTSPQAPDDALLERVAAEHGHRIDGAAGLLAEAFDVDAALRAKRSAGSANPAAVRELLVAQRAELDALATAWRDRRRTIAEALAALDRALGLGGPTTGGKGRG